MAKRIVLEVTKTYKTPENAAKAFEDKFGDSDLRYLIMYDPASGRYFPAALGMKAIEQGVHFHFHVIS
jgi:hypothetical protein